MESILYQRIKSLCERQGISISKLESERIIKEIWKLPIPQNRRVYMYIVDEFSYTKIAKIENRSIPTVKESVDRGLENLRKKLKKIYK